LNDAIPAERGLYTCAGDHNTPSREQRQAPGRADGSDGQWATNLETSMADTDQTNRPEPPAETADAEAPPLEATVRWRREHVIPLRRAEVIRLLAEDPRSPPAERDQFLRLCQMLSATFHYEYHARLEALKEAYAPFNPDACTSTLRECTDAERERLVPEVFDRFVELLQRANYEHLSRAEIEQAMGAASDWGLRLHVDFDVFRRLEVYARGDVLERRVRRSWKTRYREVEVVVPLYQRLVVIFQLREHQHLKQAADSRAVCIKLFKNIPKQDLEMLLPGTRFHLTLLDRGKILLPTVSGLALAAFKIVRGALWVAFAGVYGGAIAVLGLVGGTVGYGVKSFLGYLRTKEKYQLNLTRSLYYQNLDNNEGVLYRLLDEAEEQDFIETILAYALLRSDADGEGWTQGRLDREAETCLSELLGFAVDFEIRDALDKLARLGFASQTPDGRWHAAPLAGVCARLDRVWDGYFLGFSDDQPSV
jgi:hypothetical protein